MTKILFAMATVLALGTLGAPAKAGNLGFETGDLTGWTTNGSAGATTSYGSFTPDDGNYFGYAQAGLGEGVYTTLSQTLTLSAGSVLSGVWGFQANDYAPYNDQGYLSINGSTLLASSVTAVGNYGQTGWLSWSYDVLTGGSYTIQIGVENWIDNYDPSGVVLDNVQVPEPASMILLGAGIFGLGIARCREAA
jgi:hypothetical protein